MNCQTWLMAPGLGPPFLAHSKGTYFLQRLPQNLILNLQTFHPRGCHPRRSPWRLSLPWAPSSDYPGDTPRTLQSFEKWVDLSKKERQ